MGYGSFQQVGQESLHHVDGPIQIDIDDPLDSGIVEVFEPDERLNDAGVVNEPVHGAMAGHDPLG